VHEFRCYDNITPNTKCQSACTRSVPGISKCQLPEIFQCGTFKIFLKNIAFNFAFRVRIRKAAVAGCVAACM